MKIYPMSLWESLESSGEVSIQELFNNPDYDIDGASSKLDIPGLILTACRGGWPATLQMPPKASMFIAKDYVNSVGGWPATLQMPAKASMLIAKDYVNSVCENDISAVDNKQRNPKVARQIMKSYARNISTLAKKSNILADVTEKLFVIQDIDAWCPAIRSKTAIRSSPKRCFVDPSIAVAAMNVNAEALETQLKTFGFIFEQMCIRDLKAYTADFNSRISYYRDRYGLEADLVLHLEDGRYALIECKLGSREIDDGAKHLLELKRLIQEHNKTEKQVPIREPDLLIVITGGTMAYSRPDGVKVIPLACLKD